MPGVPGPGSELAAALEERLGRALEELRAVAEALGVMGDTTGGLGI